MLQGRMDEARHLLSKEASANPTSVNMYKILDDLMKKMPVPSVCTKWISFLQFPWEKRTASDVVPATSQFVHNQNISVVTLCSDNICVLEVPKSPRHSDKSLLGDKPMQLEG